MTGKLIITAPDLFMGLSKANVFVNNKLITKLGRDETAEIDLTDDSSVYVKIGPNPKSEVLLIRANAVTKINTTITSTSTWKAVLNIISVTPIDEYQETDKPIYNLKGARGRYLKVYEDKCIIKTVAGVGSLITGNASDGEKTIYFSDVLGIQYKKSGVQLGYLQLETASSTMNNKANNFFNENSFTFDGDLNPIMEEVQEFVKKKVDEAKKQKNAPVIVSGGVSNADELKKFKELLDMGVITQEEFDAKKKQLLGL